MSNRKAATAELVKWLDKLLPDSENGTVYESLLNDLSDEAFEAYMTDLETGQQVVSLVAPNFAEQKLSLERNLQIADELGHKFFQRLWLTDPKTQCTYLTPIPYLVVDLFVRRQQQVLVKKISIPEDNRHVDELTGQPSGPSAGSRLSYPEVQILYSQSMDRSNEEMIKFRGGDTKARLAMDRQIIETGGASQDAIKSTAPTKVKSTQTLDTLLKSAHLDTNLAD